MGFSCLDLRGELFVVNFYGLCHFQSLLKTVGEVKVSDLKLHTVFLYVNLDSFKGQLPVCDIIGVHLFQPFCDFLDEKYYLDFGHLRAP